MKFTFLNGGKMSDSSFDLICLQNILHPGNAFSKEEQVYFHRSADGNIYDLDGYFNLFYIEKHKKYMAIEKVAVQLNLVGFSSVTLMHDRDEIESFSIANPEKETRQTFEFPYESYDEGVFWVRLTKADNGSEKIGKIPSAVDCIRFDGRFFGEIKSKRLANVLVDICTYKREKYVTRNMIHLVEFLENSENVDIANSLEVAIIDNGRTLNEYDDLNDIIKEHGSITVYPNPNTGGAGGFTRGMKEAIAQKEEKCFTHVLLMDDDASFDTEMFVRLFGVLWSLREEYKDITVGGAIFRDDYTYIQFASGEWFEDLELINYLKNMDMRSYTECTQKEMCTTKNELTRYCGWWCCCYSLNVVTSDNLPLSLFIHFDDIEYEVRNRQAGNPVMLLNGIGVWHKPFESEFQRAKIYYNSRNKLICASLREPSAIRNYFEKKLRRELTGCLMNHRYLDMHLIYMGVRDFFKGTEWLESLDFEEFHKEISKYVKESITNITLDDFEKLGFADLKDEVKKFITDGISDSEVFRASNKPIVRVPLIKKITLNGSLCPMKTGAVVITTRDSLWEKGYGYRKYLFVEKDNNQIMYVKHDPKEFLEMIRIYLELKRLYKKSEWGR